MRRFLRVPSINVLNINIKSTIFFLHTKIKKGLNKCTFSRFEIVCGGQREGGGGGGGAVKDKWKFPSQLEFFIIIIILSLVSVTCSNYDFKGICFPFVHNTGVVQFRRRVWYHPQNNKRR